MKIDENDIVELKRYLCEEVGEVLVGVFVTGNDAGSETMPIYSATTMLKASEYVTTLLKLKRTEQ